MVTRRAFQSRSDHFSPRYSHGLGVLNYRLFSHAVPGLWGQSRGVVAVMADFVVSGARLWTSK